MIIYPRKIKEELEELLFKNNSESNKDMEN